MFGFKKTVKDDKEHSPVKTLIRSVASLLSLILKREINCDIRMKNPGRDIFQTWQ